MKNSKLFDFTISQFKQVFNFSESLGNDFIISKYKDEHIESLHYPCRLNAYAVIICTQGEAKATINLQEINVSPNTMVVNLPSNIFQLKKITKDFAGYVVIVSQEFLDDAHIDRKNTIPIFVQIKDLPFAKLDEEDMFFCKNYFDLLCHTIECTKEEMKKEMVQSLSSAFFYKICAILTKGRDLANGETLKKNRREVFFRDFMELLRIHHREQRSVGFYADVLNITPKYLSTVIKDVSGKSAADWIDDFVILEAKNMLKFSDMSIQELAYALNFSSQSFFGKYFKHHTGISPSQYRTK